MTIGLELSDKAFSVSLYFFRTVSENRSKLNALPEDRDESRSSTCVLSSWGSSGNGKVPVYCSNFSIAGNYGYEVKYPKMDQKKKKNLSILSSGCYVLITLFKK